MTIKNDLVGQVFDYLTVVADGGRDHKGNVLWLCSCQCGNNVRAHAYDLKAKKIVSCKCKIKFTTHGKAGHGGHRSKIYSIWAAMVNRCTNPKDRSWLNYGGRGITIHESWRNFEAFYAEVGDPPFIGASLDRKENSKGYEPGNVRWITQTEQMRNTRSNKRYTIQGISKIQADWLKDVGKNTGDLKYLSEKLNVSKEEVLIIWLRQKRVM